MKNSGIEWIGEIPDSWEYFRLKDYYMFEKGKNAAIYTQDYIGLHKGIYPVYSGQTENNGVMGCIDTFDYDLEECLFTTTVGAKVMTPKILRGKFSLSQNCLIMKKTKECNNSYIYYYLFPLFSYAKSLIPTYMQPSLRVADLNLYGFYVPDCETQYKIAKCLNEKCGKIDELIANQQGQIEKLKEYKQLVITEAITKGLDKSAPLKDSGIEWIGEIPENYIICKIKHILDNSDFGIKCGPFGSALTGKVVDNGSVLIYGQWNVVDGNFNKKRNTITGKDFDDLSAYEVLPGDILVSMMGTIGKCAIGPTDISRGIMDSHIIKIRLNNNVVLHKFFEYQYDKDNSFIVYEYFKRVKKGFIMDGLNTTLIKNAFFILPSLFSIKTEICLMLIPFSPFNHEVYVYQRL